MPAWLALPRGEEARIAVEPELRHLTDRLRGAAAITTSARDSKTFRHARGTPEVAAPLRLARAYCSRQGGPRATASPVGAVGLADISDMAWRHAIAATDPRTLAGALNNTCTSRREDANINRGRR
jgi:hypothetical protein